MCLTLLELVRFLAIVNVPVTFDYPFLTVQSEQPAVYLYQEVEYIGKDGHLYTSMGFCTGYGDRL